MSRTGGNKKGRERARAGTLPTKTDEEATRDAVLDNVQEAILAIDEVGLVQFANEAALLLLGRASAHEVVGCHYAAVLALHDRDGHDIPLEKRPWPIVTKTKQRFATTADNPYYMQSRRDGRLVPMMLALTPLYRRGKLVGGTIIFHELKERQATRDMPIDFISLASHQLRTPLTVANLHVDMLLAGHMGALTEEQRQVLDEISFYHQKINQVLVEFLVASRVELGTFMINPQPISLTAKVEEVIRDLGLELRHKEAQLSTRFESNLPLVRTDSQVVRIVVHNVLSNAIKFIPLSGRIDVLVKAKPDAVLITIKDNGVGISTADQPKIFEKMFRGDNSSAGRTSGVGFGLYVVKSLLDLVGGAITFTSAEGKGTTFVISFPRNL